MLEDGPHTIEFEFTTSDLTDIDSQIDSAVEQRVPTGYQSQLLAVGSLKECADIISHDGKVTGVYPQYWTTVVRFSLWKKTP